MKHVTFGILFGIVILGVIPAFASDDIVLYERHGFSLEHPSEWQVEDTWDDNEKVQFKIDHLGKSGISVVMSDRYELADLYKRESIKIDNPDLLLDVIAGDLQTACKINKFGPCWSFSLLDSKVIVINGQKALSIKYSATMDDEPTTFRLIMLPDGERFWYIVAKSVDNVDFGSLEKSISSFQIPSAISVNESQVQLSILASSNHDIVLEKKINVNLILIGDEWQSLRSSVQDNVPSYREPIIVASKEKMGIKHTYNYNFVSISDDQVADFSQFLKDHSKSMPITGSQFSSPIWQAYWVTQKHPEWVDADRYGQVTSYNIDYRLADALATEEYLFENFVGSNPQLTAPNSVNLVFIAMDLDDADFLRNYSVSNRDDASGEAFTAVGLMGFGGNYNMIFFDLYSAPWIDLDAETWKYTYPPWVRTLHDCNTNECKSELISFHTSESLQYIVSPDLLYSVEDADKYIVDALIYTKPGGSNTVTSQTLANFVDEQKIKEELEYLYPFSEWEITFSLERRDTRGLAYEFKQELDHTSNFVFDSVSGQEKTIQLLDTSKIKPHLITWATERTGNNQNTKKIPVLIEVDSSNQFDIYLDSFGILGIAPSMPNSDESCCAFGVTSQKKMWSEKIGFTDLLIHEVGHAMGLMHPFMSTNQNGNVTVNQYFNWYASPMTYSQPNSGCGLLFSLVFSNPCGNASLSFTEFERNMISDARLASLWMQTASNIGTSQTHDALQILDDSKTAYKNGDLYSLKGSLKLAKDALESSKTPEVYQRVPEWIKNNAKWWADGSIDDDSFVQGVQYLIKERIITISSAAGTLTGDQIPSWVKNNAKWWADGLISEDDFLKGIEFLAQQGIIKVQ